MSETRSPGEILLRKWQYWSRWPGGRHLFAWIFGRAVPYSGSIGALIQQLEPGYCCVSVKDRHAIRNHLNSIHAVALVNLGELCSGLALLSALPVDVRGIVTNISCRYLKKARGPLQASCRCLVPQVLGDTDHVVEAQIVNSDNETVALVQVQWRLGPVPQRG